MRTCNKCITAKCVDEFRQRRGKPISICKACEREKQREYYWNSPDKHRKRSADNMRKQRSNPKRGDEIRAKQREYYHSKGKNREKRYISDMRQNEPWRWRARNLKRNASQHITEGWLRRQFDEQEGRCVLSGRELDIQTLHVDHITPKSIGGSDELSNLRLVTPEANLAKSGLTDEQFISLCRDVLAAQIPEMIGYAILEAERAAA